MKQNSCIDVEIVRKNWQFIAQQAQVFDQWFGFCGIILVFGLVLSCLFVGLAIVIASSLIMVGPFFLTKFGAGWSILMVSALLIPGLVGLSRSLIWAYGFFNAIAVNALDAAHGRPLRRLKNRVTGFSYAILPIVYLLILFAGLSLFIIPGIVFGVRFSLARYIMIDRKESLWDSLIISWEMTRGYFWTLLLVYSVVWIVSYIPFVFLIDLFFPFSNLSTASLYAELKSRQLTQIDLSV